MKLVADLHLHSKYSRATSKELDLLGLYRWCIKKGISLIGTADFTHPKWFSELKENLEPAGEGLFTLKSEIRNSKPARHQLVESLAGGSETNSNVQNSKFKTEPYYVLTSEISCIYTQGGKMRRIHVVLLAPSLETVENINKQLGKRGNLFSDGRPIFGISAYDLVKLVWEIDERVIIIPAHVWTPWFSLFGSMSGFDSIEECFKDLADRIYAVETGLSSDPPMNWRLSQLDRVAIVSFGDGHSGGNLMREATVFELGDEINFDSIAEALKNSSADALGTLGVRSYGDESIESNERSDYGLDKPRQLTSNALTFNAAKPHISKTIEFYPEEGKYHFDGHRLCGVRLSPEESRKINNICPKCHRPLTIGVMHRVSELADRPEDYTTQFRPPYQSLVQLSQIVAEALGKTEAANLVKQEYDRLVSQFGNEYTIIVETSLDTLDENRVDSRIIEGIKRAREGNIHIEPGYDGVFGTVRVFEEKETVQQTSKHNIPSQQQSLF